MAITNNIKELNRLISETFHGEAGTQRLAHVLREILKDDIPHIFNGPVTFGSGFPITFSGFSDGDTLFTIVNAQGQPQGSVTFNSQQGGLQTVGISTGNVLPAVIESGAGTIYTVTIYPNGRSDTTGAFSATATHPDLDSTETIPSGTPCQVMKLGTATYEIISGIPYWNNRG